MIGGFALATLAHSGVAAAPTFAASLRGNLGGSADDRFVVPMVGRFQAETGAAFIVDRLDSRNLLVRFDSSPEIWVLQPHAGPRGDVIYKNDVGDPVLRATRVGGLTFFPSSKSGGVAAAFAGGASSLRPPPVSNPSALLQSFTQASARAGRATRQIISFEARDVPLQAAPLVADAAQVAAEAFIHAAGTTQGMTRGIGRWSLVEFVMGRSPGASASNGTLRVTLAPDRGLAGRPSSQRISAVILKARPAQGPLDRSLPEPASGRRPSRP